VVGITGTNGKTTTKEMTASILSSRYKVLKNTGNLNNQIGLPLSMMELDPSYEAAVLEMGASAPGDIRELCQIAEPTYGVLTNIGHAHIEGFKDIGMVRKAKMELLDSVGSVAVNADDAFLVEGIQSYGGRVVRFGIESECEIRATDIELGVGNSAFTIEMGGQAQRVEINVSGLFNIYNALAAASVAHMLGLGPEAVSLGLKEFSGVPMRVEIKEFHGAMVISDVYNANPASMEEALKELVRLRGRRAIAVLGDMLELGSYSEAAHRRLGEWMSRFPVDLFIAVGPNMELAAEEFEKAGKTVVRASDAASARQVLLGYAGEGDTVLVKGSRTMRMELVLGNGANGRAEVMV
jgi:UDP-N-acetylmuramoyl-tripeptide--D-alanyl-D-alanine ligase